jgi:hypothetical protein
MFPHAAVTAAMEGLRASIAQQNAWAEQQGYMLEDGEADLLAARRELARELREEAALLLQEEESQGQWTDYGAGRKSETEVVIIGLKTEMDEYALAGILGGGLKVRYITMTEVEAFVSYHFKKDAAEALTTASTNITNAGGPETVVTMARYKPNLHGHEENRMDRSHGTNHTQCRLPAQQEVGSIGAKATTKQTQARGSGQTGAKANANGKPESG